ncbi:SGT1 protein-domain-containing protein [Sphaerosporella brunnea]|uniref:SGT1 protein-domain-containing protein n=1 Tax=Sphaerosporella brunnea TaxID=1250544 RepID=A0A5J5F1S1_9PEZI|nr:SGT1 protein-domain-containing protein [Sphaerosporella brunnea]
MSTDPTQDPFSPYFTGPFQGIPTRTLPSDTLAFSIHLLSSATPDALQQLQASLLSLAAEWGKDYIWQRTPFSAHISPDGTHISGTLEYGDAIDDEWFAVAILLEASRRHPEAWIRVFDSDGEFLLIEAAHALPRWLSPEIAEHRVWIRQGKLWIIPYVKGGEKRISLSEALRFLEECRMEALVRDKDVEREALARTREYPAAARRHLHRARIVVPRKVAALLNARPESVAAAVEAFYIRDPVSLKALQRPREETVFPWTDTVEVTAAFTKVLFAQLKGQMWLPPFEARFPLTEEGKVDVGVKLTAGYEILLARENDVLLTSDARRSMVQDLRALLQAGLKEPTDQEIAAWPKDSDGEEWLNIDFSEFEKDLKGGNVNGGWGEAEQEGKLKKMVDRFEQFLNDDRAGLGGALHSDEEDDDMSDSELEEGEDKDVSFDEEEFERMMREMMGLPPDKDTEEILRMQAVMEAELKQAGALQEEKAPGLVEERKEKEGDSDIDDYDEERQVSLDYTLAKNLLESFKGQDGMSGPAGTLLARMGMRLPRDEPEEAAVVGKGKGKEVV